jgi:SAM-dependent methyltransferase
MLRGDFFVLRNLKEFLESTLRERVKPGTRVADVGCGEQPLRALITTLGGRYTAIDLHQNADNTVDVLADITSIPLPDEAFDLLVCSEVLEHVSDPNAALAELGRLCQPGGSIVITTPFAYPLHEEPRDFVRLTPYQLTRYADGNQLEVVQLTTAGDELQVLATVWCNLWSRSGPQPRSLWRAFWNAAMRLPVNAMVYALGPAVRSLLPHKYFLSTFCILAKPGGRAQSCSDPGISRLPQPR